MDKKIMTFGDIEIKKTKIQQPQKANLNIWCKHW